jgi:hypothetical protein
MHVFTTQILMLLCDIKIERDLVIIHNKYSQLKTMHEGIWKTLRKKKVIIIDLLTASSNVQLFSC